MALVKVKAKERGFAGGQFREIGAEFDVEKDKLGKWMTVIGPKDTLHEDRPEDGNVEEPAGDIVPPMPDPKTTPHEDRPEGGDVEPPASLAKVKGKRKA